MVELVPVILSGGTGSRLWPLSRELYPKQLLPLVGELTMLQDTVLRVVDLPGVCSPIVVCNEEHRFMVAEQLRAIDSSADAIMLEPCGRNTAPAVAVAAFEAVSSETDPLLLVLPADHAMKDVAAFQKAVAAGIPLAMSGKLVTFGIVPTSPDTGYGYINAGESLDPVSGACRVARFVEKPNREIAGQYVASGEYFWNSGMFLFSAQRYLRELQTFAPEMLNACRNAFMSARREQDFIRLDKSAFAASPSNSIDYAVMEKTADAVVIPLDAGWSDVGAWSALWEIGAKDEDGNVVRGDVLSYATKNCYIYAESRLVSTVGVEQLVVIETADAVLVADRSSVQDVKAVVAALNASKRKETISHCRVSRPWGAYQSVDKAERFHVKRITVNPGASLSLQMHHHRAEHWVVVKGTARITKGDEKILLSENQSIYIPLGVTHRLENPGVIPLELIEVQSGSYLGEDDIVRFEDTYGRA
jgi:mannose-1-phosphate guanylyltransferase / mannose-6-phosphate isomerase